MTSNQRSKGRVPTTLRLVKILSLAILMLLARQAFADCDADQSNGWQIGSLCQPYFSPEGNFVGAFCRHDASYNPTNNTQNECLQGYDQGMYVCSGSSCEADPADEHCTYHGVCDDDFDCCSLNWCDRDLHRCQDWGGGGGGDW